MRVLLFVFVAVLVNLPYAHERWTDHRVSSRGTDVVATVLSERKTDSGYLVEYRLPEDVDRRQTHYSASVDRETYANAVASDRIAVRVVPGDPDANRPLGLVPSSLFAALAIAADAVLLLIAGAAVYRRRRTSLT